MTNLIMICAEEANESIATIPIPSTTDWIMVVVTIIYVIATIFIFIANNKSAKASRAQVEKMTDQIIQSQEQYDETKRLNFMPFIMIERIENDRSDKPNVGFFLSERRDTYERELVITFQIHNIGNGSAKNIKIKRHGLNIVYDEDNFFVTGLFSNDKLNFSLTFTIPSTIEQNSVYMEFLYQDLLDNSYSQKVEFILSNLDGKPIYHGIINHSPIFVKGEQ